MGTSVQMIDRTYGHLARDSEDAIRARLNIRSGGSGVGRRMTVSALTLIKPHHDRVHVV
jgi:hypothetical protein